MHVFLGFESVFRINTFGVFSVLWLFSEAILIQTGNGPVKGRLIETESFSIYNFRNIPYAKPPLGNLRLEKSKEADPWLSTKDLKQPDERISCPQKLENAALGQEDCLLLDVYIQKNEERDAKLLPVLIYFHAGQFSFGSKEEYHPEYLLSLHDIIVVIPNYRLGILGFLSSDGDVNLSGNLGLWDQRLAMKWVQDNIEHFGGDKSRVTISGHDAGGASVGFHILSPETHGLFSAAISASGTALDPWAFSYTSASTMTPVAEKIGCPQNPNETLVDCLKQCDLDKILEAQRNLKKVQFLPVVDGVFLPEKPQKLYQWGHQKNVTYLAGVTKNEAAIEVYREYPNAVKHRHLDSIIEHLLEPYLKGTPDLHIIAKAAKYHYLRGAVIPSFMAVQPLMEMMLTDFLYNSPLHMALNLHSLTTLKAYMYVFSFNREDNPFGVSHMTDAYYIFNKTFQEWNPKHPYKLNVMRTIMCNIWGNFVKHKFPGSATLWKQFKGANELNYVDISKILSHKTNYRKSDMEFWNLLIPNLKFYHNLNMEKSQTTPAPKGHDSTAWGIAGLAVMLMVLCVALVGVVIVSRKKFPHSSIIPTSSPKDVKYSNIE